MDGIVDADLQQYLRLHARADDFSTTVQKAKQYVEAQELAKHSGASPKKPAIRIASRDDRSPSHDRQTTRILDGLERILTTVVRSDDQLPISSRGRSREAKRRKKARVRVVGTSPQGNDIPPRTPPRCQSPASTQSSVTSSRTAERNRSVRFQDDRINPSSRQGASASDRSRSSTQTSASSRSTASRSTVFGSRANLRPGCFWRSDAPS